MLVGTIRWAPFEVTAFAPTGEHEPVVRRPYVCDTTKADVNAALDALSGKGQGGAAYTPVVINTGSKLVAIDTGLGFGMFEQSEGAVGRSGAQFGATGIDRR